LKEGIKIDPNRVDGILKIETPHSKKEVQSFLGKVNFLRRFIPNLDKIIKYITFMLRKGNDIKWNMEAKNYFEYINGALTKSPMLSIPYFMKDFILYSFTSQHTIVGVLLQKDDQDFIKPISYFNMMLH
jgi:hypothetical protein